MSAPAHRITAPTTGAAIATLLLERTPPETSTDTTDGIASLAEAIDRFYADSTGTFSIEFTDAGATLKLPDTKGIADAEAALRGFENQYSLEELGEVEPDDIPNPDSVEPKQHTILGRFTDTTPISFSDEIVVVRGRVKWRKPI